MNTKRTVFLTGATGLVGSYLLKILLENGNRVYTLARSKNNQSAKNRVIGILKFWDERVLNKNIHNLVALEGDITKEGFGLSKKTKDMLCSEVEEIFHCAAATQFNWPLEKIRKVNVIGTKNVLDFSLQCKDLKKVNHISTAYVCGDYKGVFREDDLDMGQKFNSTYEQSKFEAEKLVQSYRKEGLWIDIFRPLLIVGESTTGKTFMFNMAFYQTLHIWSLEILDVFPCKKIQVNIIPIDVLSKNIYTITSHTVVRNKNYHPFCSQTISLEEILNTAAKLIRFNKPKAVSLEAFDLNSLTNAQKLLLQDNIFSLNPAVIFDSTATSKILRNYGFVYPRITKDTLSKIVQYPFKVQFKDENVLY